MQKCKRVLKAYAHIFVAVLLVLQPIMDVLSYWFQILNLSSAITLVLRMVVLMIACLWGFCISERKWIYWTALLVMGAIYGGHVFACLQVGFVNPITDCANYVRVVQMPLLVLVFSTCLKENRKSYSWILKGAVASLGVIFTVELLSVLTNTDPHVYGNRGIMGWFNNTNSQSAILSIVVPFAMLWFLRKVGAEKQTKSYFLFAGIALIGYLLLFFFGTRLAYAAIFGITLGFVVSILIAARHLWRYAVVLLLLAAVFAGIYPFSVMYRHQQSYKTIQKDRQEVINQAIEGEVEDLLGTIQQEEIEEAQYHQVVEALTPIYMAYMKDFVKIFGLEETMKMYNFTTDTFVFTDARQKKIKFAQAIMEESPVSAQIFGVEYARFTVGETVYDVENDFHGIFFLYGWTGIIAYVSFVLYFLGLIVWALWKDFRKYFTLEAATCGISLILCLVHAFFTAGVLRRPNASVYLSLLLALVYYFVRLRKDINICNVFAKNI